MAREGMFDCLKVTSVCGRDRVIARSGCDVLDNGVVIHVPDCFSRASCANRTATIRDEGRQIYRRRDLRVSVRRIRLLKGDALSIGSHYLFPA